MGGDRTIKVSLPTDEKGMVGRRCPLAECGDYFKLRPGTGLPIKDCGCPYCGKRGGSLDFATQDQIEYAKRVAAKQVLEPLLSDFKRSVEGLNRPSRGSLIDIKFSVSLPTIRVHSYREGDVETDVRCDSCGLEFAVFGVFALCPDCGQLNAFRVFDACLEVCRRRLVLLDKPETSSDQELTKAILVDTLGSAVSAFDALGKKLRATRPGVLPAAPKNLFQNLDALDRSLQAAFGRGLAVRLGVDAGKDLVRLFQIRHIYEHNLGVIDDDFVAKLPAYSSLKGRTFPLGRADIELLLDLLRRLAATLETDLGGPHVTP